ncbi:MAG: phosphoglycerate kinase [Candidatus Pacebacteria bacterium]|nr:phosphoglycerate kinase [Candidatus Paceibacterota bacterium]
MFRSLYDYNFFGKKVLVRCDFNVPVYKGKVLDDFKIIKALSTIKYLRESGAKIILASHIAQEGRWQKASLRPVVPVLEGILNEKVLFCPKSIGSKPKRMIDKMGLGKILVLENLRINKGEERNDEKFAKELAALAEIYVGEAFGCCHRKHSSIVITPKLLPHFIGFECEREANVLSSLIENPQRPLVVLIGGAKVESKLKMIARFLPMADYLLFGGKIANILLAIQKIIVGGPKPSQETKDLLLRIDLTNPKINLPLDVLASFSEEGIRQIAPGSVRKEEEILDIGQATIEKFSEIIKIAKTIFWSGNLGLVEDSNFRNGSLSIARAIIKNEKALKIAGGGDTVAFIRAEGLEKGFSYLSSGGSALLEFIAKGTLPGIEALKI